MAAPITATKTCRAQRLPGQHWLAGSLLWLIPLAIALIGARKEPGSWNDGGRLATVECLVDYGTFAIDRSVFVKLPTAAPPGSTPARYDTKDRIRVNGRFYSHRPPLLAVALAGCYWLAEECTGLKAREDCDQFCRWMTRCSSGLAYVCAVVGVFYVAQTVGLARRTQWLLAGSFALATLAPVYSRNVNDHIVLLALAVAMSLLIAQLNQRAANPSTTGKPRPSVAALLGTLAGLAYAIDAVVGTVLLGATAALVTYRSRHWQTPGWFVFGALPWLICHHWLNYLIVGTVRPAGTVPELFAWPGSPFTVADLTGFWHHTSYLAMARYALAMLFGPRGFLWHNLPLVLVPLAAIGVWRRGRERRVDVVWVLGCSIVIWLIYASLSNNYAGQCRSIRWFLPVLAPAYYLLALGIRAVPQLASQLWLLSGFGGIATACLWRRGPWSDETLPIFWFAVVLAVGGSLLLWTFVLVARRNNPHCAPPQETRRVSEGPHRVSLANASGFQEDSLSRTAPGRCAIRDKDAGGWKPSPS